jgi:hypothetical protein
MSAKEEVIKTEEEETNVEDLENQSGSETEGEEDDNEEEDDDDERIPVDLSQNEFYRGICTLLEDEDGNNILEYISLLHTELIGINKSLENLRSMRKDIGRIADCAELFMKSKKGESSSGSSDVKREEKKDEKKKKERS